MLCLVTDRRRLCAEGTPLADAHRCLVAQARFAAAAGIDLIQVRERDLDTRRLAAIVADCVRVTRGTATRVVVNDRLDVALACGADGVHLRGDSMSAAAVRRMTPPAFVVGRSVHTRDEAGAPGPVDYLIAGTVYSTVSKPAGRDQSPAGGRPLGLEGFRQLLRVAEAPVLAIGGLTIERAREVRAAGAAGVAAIGLFIGPGRHRGCGAAPLGDLAAALGRGSDR
jgi:thiamine-phosphate pyrophosphorylase